MSETQLAAAAAAAVGPSAAEEQAVTSASGLSSVRRGQGQEAEGGQDPKDAAVADSINDAWTRSVEWVGTVRERGVAGADIGNRLYAGKKRMFKGHKWERGRERRVARTKMLLRDMDKRVQRFKAVRFNQRSLSLFPSFLFFFLASALLTVFSLVYFIVSVPCQGQAVAAGKKVQCVEEDAEAAVLTPRHVCSY